MKRKSMHSVALAVLVASLSILGAESAQAQYPTRGYGTGGSFGRGPQSRPSFSPYLNLLRGGNSTLFNYYGLVRPEQDFRQADSQFQQGFGQLRSDVRDLRDPRNLYRGSTLQDSGHSVGFFSDLRGSEGSVSQTIGNRFQALDGLQPHPWSRRPPTGHGAWFGNRGSYFPSSRQNARR